MGSGLKNDDVCRSSVRSAGAGWLAGAEKRRRVRDELIYVLDAAAALWPRWLVLFLLVCEHKGYTTCLQH